MPTPQATLIHLLAVQKPQVGTFVKKYLACNTTTFESLELRIDVYAALKPVIHGLQLAEPT